VSRPVAILVPQRTAGTYSGGHLTQLRLAEALAPVADVSVIEYDIRRPRSAIEHHREVLNDSFVICGVGSHIQRLAALLASERVVYWANSVGWFNSLDSRIPILAASRYTLGYLGEICPDSFLAYLPNPLPDEFTNERRERTIDVLVQRRKCSEYVLEVLVPELRKTGLSVTVLDKPVDSLADYFNRSRVFLYDSRDHWLRHNLSEGFGLPPLEALACGCVVFSSVNAGLSDFIDPGVNAFKIAAGSLGQDVAQITSRVADFDDKRETDLNQFGYRSAQHRWIALEPLLEVFFESRANTAKLAHRRLTSPRTYSHPPRRRLARVWRRARVGVLRRGGH
jgi:glycosyltransferase involved in cell wall biosynthesis